MKTIAKISCLVWLCFMFPLTTYAADSVEEIQEEINIQTEILNGRLGNINHEIKNLEDDISTYGEDYTYNYKTSNNTLNTQTKETYSIQSNSILTNEKENDKSISELLEEKQNEKEQIDEKFLRIEELQETIDNFSKIEFDSQDVTKPSYLTVEEIEFILKDTKLESLAQDFYDAEQEYGVNAFFIISIAAHESGWGTSSRAVNDNNLTGFGVYSDSSEGINSSTKRDNIMLTTKTLKNNYLTKGGSCYHGLSVYDVSLSYCESRIWHTKVTNIGNNLKNELLTNFLKEVDLMFLYD